MRKVIGGTKRCTPFRKVPMSIPMTDIEARTKTVVAKTLNIAEWIISSNSTLAKLGADSLDAIGIVMAVEREFGCVLEDDVFSPRDQEKAQLTFRDFVRTIEQSVAK